MKGRCRAGRRAAARRAAARPPRRPRRRTCPTDRRRRPARPRAARTDPASAACRPARPAPSPAGSLPARRRCRSAKSVTPYSAKGGVDRRARLDRVHEMHLGARAAAGAPARSRAARRSRNADAAGPHRAQHARLRVALDGIEDIARKRLDKAPRGARRSPPDAGTPAAPPGARARRRHRSAGEQPRAGRTRAGNKTGFRHRTILPEQGGDTARRAR